MSGCDCLRPGTVASRVRDCAVEYNLLPWFDDVHRVMHEKGFPTQDAVLWQAAIRGAQTKAKNQKARQRMAGL